MPAILSDLSLFDDDFDDLRDLDDANFDDLQDLDDARLENAEPTSSLDQQRTPEAELSSPPPPKSRITSFWKIATPSEKEETCQSGFQQIRDRQELVAAIVAKDSRKKLERSRTLARERQQAHRDRSKERKMSSGWVPREKRVSILRTLRSCYS
jgi:hypothetical protein